MRIRWIGLAIFLVPAAYSQSPTDVTLTLAGKGGRTQFKQGEAIELQLQFQSTAPGKYGVWQLNPNRTGRNTEYDKFTAEPAGVDPLASAGISAQAFAGPPPKPDPINGGAVAVNLFLNEWISFRKPGHYRVSAETTRLVTMAQQQARLPMKSSVLEVEITPFDPAWAETQLKQATAVLALPDPSPGRVGERSTVTFQDRLAAIAASENAARTVRFLETPEAARLLARYLGRGPMYSQAQVRAGMAGTPYRKELLATLEEMAENPSLPIVIDQYFALQDAAVTANIGPPPLMPLNMGRDEMRRWIDDLETPYHERAKPFADAVTARMITTLAKKSGEALAVSLATLGGTGTQAPSPALARALVENLGIMPDNNQFQWLTSNWPRIASPDVEPALKKIAASDSDLRDQALLRLNDLDPAAVRPIALERIRQGDVNRQAHHNDRALLMLADKTLPELDDALAANFERGIVHADWLLARYATAAVEGRVKAYLEYRPDCNGPIMAYLFRVDPDYAAQRLAQARAGRGCSLGDLQGKEDLFMTPALEQQLIKDLNPAITHGPEVNGLAGLLQNGGSPASKGPLMETMARPVDYALPPGGSADGRVSYALTAAGWIPSAEDFDKLLAGCQSDICRKAVTGTRSQMGQPVGIFRETGSFELAYVRMGPFTLRSAQQVKDKIAQYPKGTSFYVGVQYPGSWWAEHVKQEFGAMVEAAGMKLVEPPAARR